MKFAKVLIGIAFAVLLIFSCSKENFSTDENLQDVDILKVLGDEDSRHEKIVLNCSGNCTDGKCYLTGSLGTGIFECGPCSKCSMTISNSRLRDDYVIDLDYVLKDFEKSTLEMSSRNGEVRIQELEFQKSEKNEFVKISYFFDLNPSKVFTVSYLQELGKKGPI